MNQILSEKEYQKYIMDRLKEDNGYVIRNANKNYDRMVAMDKELLFKFLNNTQPETMEALRRIYKDKLEDTLVNFINQEITKESKGLINVLKRPIEISNYQIYLMYGKPATTINKELNKLYKSNIFSVMEEVWINNSQRIDLVLFINGLAVISFELKCNPAGQSYQDAIYQYRKERDYRNRLFLFKAGCLVNFAMDLNEVYMTTRLQGEKTFFLPFNMGNGKGIDAGQGNPIFKDKYSVSYMWEDILTKDTLTELIYKFIFIEKKDPQTDKMKKTETLIFPRYHQLDVIRKILEDVKENKTSQNYLIQHSAGSGKTNSIAWLAHRLSSFHDDKDKIIYDNIVVVSDRVVVDRQLQAAITGIEHKSGLIRVMDEKCSSKDLASALNGNTKIIATTIQKFPYIVESVKGLSNKKFAVIIDEAHSSTSGKDMDAIRKTLGSTDEEAIDMEDIIGAEVKTNGKRPNVSMFAFTATPKPTTLQLFGKVNERGQREAFHIYSMKQAIEEGFILDVLQNFTPYETFYKINKKIIDDPSLETNKAKKQIARFVKLHETNIAQKVEIIVEHFRTTVMQELGGQAKAMVVTDSRESAVKYKIAFEKYVARKGYSDIHALVAFSGKVKIKGDSTEYSESFMNKFSEDKTAEKFDTDEYQVLLVANKYQTGFDQDKLCAMYVLKKLKGVNAVQTFSRLNRICPPYNKKTFILDFVNDYKDIEKSFATYYTTTILSNSVTPEDIYELEAKVDGYYIIDPDDIESANEILCKNKADRTDQETKKIIFYLNKCKKLLEQNDIKDQLEFVGKVRRFIRFYEFLMQVSCFEDKELHKKYHFLVALNAFLDVRRPGGGFNLDGKITASDFVQKKGQEIKKSNIKPDPIVHLTVADAFDLTEDKIKRLSEIIEEINNKTGKKYDNDVAVKAMLQIKDILMKSEKLRNSAKNNTEKDFEFSYYDDIDDALVEGLEQNKDFFTLLLNNKDIKKEVLGIFASEIYNMLRRDE